MLRISMTTNKNWKISVFPTRLFHNRSFLLEYYNFIFVKMLNLKNRNYDGIEIFGKFVLENN